MLELHRLFDKLRSLQAEANDVIVKIVSLSKTNPDEVSQPAPLLPKGQHIPVKVRVLEEINSKPDKLFAPSVLATQLKATKSAVQFAILELWREGAVIKASYGLYRAVGSQDPDET